MTTFKALLVLRNANPVCQSSLQELAGPCRDRMLLSKSSLVTQFSCLCQRIMRNSPGQGWQRCHRKGMPGWSPASPVPRMSPASPAPEHPACPHHPQTQRWAVHVKVTGGTHLLWSPQPGSSADKKQKRAFKPQTVQSQIRDPWSYLAVISKLGRSL